ncbi:MAG: M48 family metallopeptidase [Planctomycetes bacterium]|nr:M48 family metallopeptidase [Planctomycetota bacterium]
MNDLGAQAYQEETGKYKVLRGTKEAQMIERVGQRIAKASGRDYQWEFKLLDAPNVVNAFCLPGGKIAFYTGILPICANEDGVAIVMGHEVAHATSGHGAERMSQGLAAEIVLAGVSVGLDLGKMSTEKKETVLGALGVGASVGVMLPFSREHESEADEIGLRFAIRAGYDPNAAPLLWERMAKMGDGGPEFLSTHPDPARRAERLRELIPRLVAEEKARAAGGAAR